MSLLDCGCGPGVITVGLAKFVSPGEVHGVDLFAGQLADARVLAEREGASVTFHQASAYELPFDDGCFDIVFAHALLEHLADPVAALREMARVLRPSGLVGVCSPDWGGFIVTPPSDELAYALEIYTTLQRGNGGNPLAGRSLGAWALEAGFNEVHADARYERYEDPNRIAQYLALQLAEAHPRQAKTLRAWAKQPGAMFAQAWISAVVRR
jgi:SAM-dependent methyltransferase